MTAAGYSASMPLILPASAGPPTASIPGPSDPLLVIAAGTSAAAVARRSIRWEPRS